MADRGDGPRSRYLIGRNTRNSKVAGGCDSPPPGACELRCSRQPKRATIATADYVGVWRPASRLWHIVAGTALPFYRFAEPSISERRLGTVSAENSSSGLIRSR